MEILVTNNILVSAEYKNIFKVDYIEGSFHDVLTSVRDYIHGGHKLLTHPLSGSVKPNETIYKSVLISKDNSGLDLQSLNIIEESIVSFKKFALRDIPEIYLQDLREVDFTLISSALNNYLK